MSGKIMSIVGLKLVKPHLKRKLQLYVSQGEKKRPKFTVSTFFVKNGNNSELFYIWTSVRSS